VARDDEHSLRRAAVPLAVAAWLAAVAGFVDAVGFDRIGVFPSNQSGNVVFFGMAVGGTSPTSASRAGISILGFLVGVAVAFALAGRLAREHRPTGILALELVPLIAVVFAAGTQHGSAITPGAQGLLAIALASFAMGAQTEVIRRVAGVAITTTFQSGTVARAAEAVVSSGPRTPRRDRAWAALGVVSIVLVSYATGAMLGAVTEQIGRWTFVIPSVAIALLLVAVLRSAAVRRALAPPDG
jgi:uncharacterized membrane protein YoaK (UPF0700 family)